MKNSISFFMIILIVLFSFCKQSFANESKIDSLKKVSLHGLKFRSIGPAITGGRISSIAVNPINFNEYYVGSGHGSLWKTTNRGITFEPVFDSVEPYAIGYVAIDPTNPNVVWVGTGENNNQNNVIYGDGIYKSEDGGKTWKNMGLKKSEHVTGIAIDPNNSNIVYASAYGSLRMGNEERGIYKTVDGGKTWNKILNINEYTGFYQIHMDPRYSNILYAVAHQRMRKLYSGIYGGDESGIYRSTDSGKSWDKLKNGFPTSNVGRIGMDISPVNPDIVYAIVEATGKDQGFYRSTDRGASWTKMNDYASAYKFYFQKIFADTKDADRVYSLDVFLKVTEDGGKTWKNAGSENKHVDDHFLWINPEDNNHLINGCDGGVYESYDQAKNWNFKANLPITEIYKVSTDNEKPFYNVYFGTQDNNSLMGPSRTINSSGITNRDWIYTNTGDGFETQVDWKDPNIVYAQWQNGGLVRFDRKSGERYYIKPSEFSDTPYRFDWDSPLLISRHDNKRIYYGTQFLLRSDDQGSTWTEVSGDLTRGVPKEIMKLMNRSWSIDELARKSSMANLSSIAESPLDENILYAGSADGLIHYTTDGGKKWNKSSIKGLPQYARVHHIVASFHDKSVAYAACQNFVDGDKKPYLYKTNNSGRSWLKINGNLPERGSTYSVQEDHVNKNLLFVGTQFGVYFTNDGGKEWVKLKSGMSAHSVMDLEIQRDENDLVVSTFGRGVYILDDFSALRSLSIDMANKDAHIFPIKNALMFIEANPLGYGGKASQGASFYTAPNPEIGAVFTYYLKEGFKTQKEIRREKEKELIKDKKNVKHPTYEQLKKESVEPEKYLLFTISDEAGNVVRKIKSGATKGINRLVWNFRYNAFNEISLESFDDSVPWVDAPSGYMVVPGKYKVSISKFENGKFSELVAPQEFVCKSLNNTTLPAKDKVALDAFNKKVAELTRAISGADAFRSEMVKKLGYLKKAVIESAEVPNDTYQKITATEQNLRDLNTSLNGDKIIRRFKGASPTSLIDRLELITYSLWNTTAEPTNTLIKSYDFAAERFDGILSTLKSIDGEIKMIEETLEKHGAPFTPGRFPEWRKK